MKGRKEKVPAAMIRMALETPSGGELEVWGEGNQTRSFLYIDECLEDMDHLMKSDFIGPVNIGSEEMVTINQIAEISLRISNKNIRNKNIFGQEFFSKYKFKCSTGVKYRNSDNILYESKISWKVSKPRLEGISKTHFWIEEQ